MVLEPEDQDKGDRTELVYQKKREKKIIEKLLKELPEGLRNQLIDSYRKPQYFTRSKQPPKIFKNYDILHSILDSLNYDGIQSFKRSYPSISDGNKQSFTKIQGRSGYEKTWGKY